MRLEPLLQRELVAVLEGVGSVKDLMSALAGLAAPAIGLPAETIEAAMLQREEQGPTTTPEGVAFPHALLPQVAETIVIIARVAPPVSFAAPAHPPADLVFAIVGGTEKPWEHIKLLARLARVARGVGALDRFRQAKDAQALFDAVLREDRAHA